MEIHNLGDLDNAIFYGIVNERLRLECSSLDDLVSQFEIDPDQLNHKLDEMGCYYDPLVNQLRPK